MNKIVLISCSALFALACTTANHDATAQQPARNAAGAPAGMTSYGAEITPDGAMNIMDFKKAMQGKETLEAKVACEVLSSCTVKGCWMDVSLGNGETMKVRFADYGFFVPKSGLEGKTAVLQGTATRETVSVDDLRHYAQDAGKSKEEIAAITEPETTIGFVATGVLIGD